MSALALAEHDIELQHSLVEYAQETRQIDTIALRFSSNATTHSMSSRDSTCPVHRRLSFLPSILPYSPSSGLKLLSLLEILFFILGNT